MTILHFLLMQFGNLLPQPLSQLILYPSLLLNQSSLALACVAQWIEHEPANQRITSSIPGLGDTPGL